MAKLKPGDCIDVRVKDATIVGPYDNYDEVKTFQIIAKDKYGYYLYIPSYYLIKNTYRADIYQCQQLKINSRFLNEEFIYIKEKMVLKVHSILDGMTCSNCHEFFNMAEPNQDDGTLICYSCRLNPYR